MSKKNFLFLCYVVVLIALAVKFAFFDQSNSTGNASILTASQETQQRQTLQSVTQTLSPAETAWVKRTVDGDTLDVIVNGKEEKVRLLGINSPESVDPRRPVECYGKEASHQMDLLATSHNVTMAGDQTNQDRDKYQRLLRYVYLEDGTFVNARMVERGYAFAYTVYPFEYMKNFIELERKARESELGLWNSAVCPYYRTN